MIKSPVLYIVFSIMIIMVLLSYIFNWSILDILIISSVSFVCAYLSVFIYDKTIQKYVCNEVYYPY